MNKEKIALVVPIYNVLEYLSECVNSLLNQDYENIEILLINDGSTKQNNLELAKEFALKDERIIVIDKINGGLGNARNVGIHFYQNKYNFEKINNANLNTYKITNNNPHQIKALYTKNELKVSKIKYIYFVDSDDFLSKDALSKCLNAFQKDKDINVVWADFARYYDNISDLNTPTQLDLYNIKKDMIINTKEWLKLINTNNKRAFWFGRHGMIDFDFLSNIKLEFINNIIHEDHYFGMCLFMQAKKIYVLKDKIYFYRIRANSIMSYDKQITKDNLNPAIYYLYDEFLDASLAKKYHKCFSLIRNLEAFVNFANKYENKDLAQKFLILFAPYLLILSKDIMTFNKDPKLAKEKFLNLVNILFVFHKNICYMLSKNQ
ncbi:glycosyltransferase family 2 protein [Campylobacter canadensis]|uniref:glycosyltransferase family 2 protein n=1 Tax=Campylobacter canadensis TaxID=449520 RepID=UPI0015550831|nr:glycosyltransferase family 2 protein [Campylobacter canadensis]